MAVASLWGEEFDITPTPQVAKQIKNKLSNPKSCEISTDKIVKSKSIPIEEKIAIITQEVYRILGSYKDRTTCIKTKQELKDYIDVAIANGIIAMDTETNNSLDPLTCKLMGPCIYTPGQKNAYIPIHHVDKDGNRLPWQLTEADIKEEFDRLASTFKVYHNGKFDYEVFKCTSNYITSVDWDTEIAARLLNENEHANLKEQYQMHIDSSQEKYNIEHLFKGLPYEIFDPELFALYAATDAFMTYELYKYQKELFEQPDNAQIYELFKTVELPLIEVVANMELNGVCIDDEFSNRLSAKFHQKLAEADVAINKEFEKYSDMVAQWRLTPEANTPVINEKTGKAGKTKNEQLEFPLNTNSPTQMAIFIYDILKKPIMDKKHPRATGADIIEQLKEPVFKLIVERRSLDTLISAFIDKLPSIRNSLTNKVHGHFNQLGTDTGRFSSQEPNLQNIPSHEHTIRMMFKASDGYVMIGSDFSQQEPRILSHFSQDESMIGAYVAGKDLYSTIASGVYNNKYEDNLEHNPDGTINPEGKKRRGSVKSLLLGIMYGMGVNSIAEKIGKSIKEAEEFLNNFYRSYPKVKNWMDTTENDAARTGYVTDLWGRRRRLNDILLPEYSLKYTGAGSFNPLLYTQGASDIENKLYDKYNKLLKNIKSKNDYEAIKKSALNDKITITNNSVKVSRARRQCVNARIQGSAATMTKKAMIAVHNDQVMKDIGFRLLIPVHDELLGECPIEFAEIAKKRLSELMIASAKPECSVPMKCDADCFTNWYEDVVESDVKELYNDLIAEGVSKDAAFEKVRSAYTELSEEQINKFIS